ILSLTWALATVSFPASATEYPASGNEIIFMFLRRFFFIYALAVIYDLRDLRVDRKAGMETIASRYGENGTKLWAITSLAMFLLFTYTDPALSTPGNQSVSAALLLSALLAGIIILNTHKIRNKSYYSLIVDSAMPVQFLLVLLFHQS
ncbi:MAG TPA: UbiA family prenyltransferase, partial [Chitinophagaceae bacterium]|nr:UbiA family prenyltransferase [Chitinophagaceae bacterium]